MEKKSEIAQCLGVLLGAQAGFFALVAGPRALMAADGLTFSGWIVLSALGVGVIVYSLGYFIREVKG